MAFTKSEFAANLRAWRARRNITQQDLADTSGIDDATISMYEDGAYTPGSDKLCQLADALGCTPNDLLGWD